MRKLEVLNGKVTGKDENGKIVNYYKGDFIDVSEKEAKTLLSTRNFKDVTDALNKERKVEETQEDPETLEGEIDPSEINSTVTIKKPSKK